MNHTPGPWRWNGGHNVTVSSGSCVIACTDGTIHRDHYTRPDAERCANARLIAAAPALLDALQALESSMTMHDGGDVFGRAAGTWSIEARAKARAAVAAARGGA